MPTYRRNHYVPQWFQERFIPQGAREQKFHYLDLRPESKVSPGGHRYTRHNLLRWGPIRCFYQDDLYTTKLGKWESTDIEQYFFGRVDSQAQDAIACFSDFQHPDADGDLFHTLLSYMCIQLLRKRKGLAYLASLSRRVRSERCVTSASRPYRIFTVQFGRSASGALQTRHSRNLSFCSQITR